MRVWVVGRGIPTVKNNMLGSFELEQAKMLSRAGFDVCYFGMNFRSLKDLRFGHSYGRTDSVETAAVNLPLSRFISEEKLKKHITRNFLKAADRMAERFGMPDVIHVHYPTQFTYAMVAPYKEKGVKIVATEHWSKVQEKKTSKTETATLTEFCRKCDAMICVGSNLKNSVLELTGIQREIHVIPNVVNADFLRTAPKSGEGFGFIAVGRMAPEKQFDKIVKAFASAFGDIPGVTLTIAGNGKEYSKIKETVTETGMTDRISLPGMVPRGELAELTASSGALVSYSVYETFCVPIIEAWACGKPVIASSVITVVMDNDDDRLGVKVDCHDTESLKEAMLDMYKNHSRYDSEWIAGYAKDNFSEESVIGRLTAIYNQICS